MATMTTAPGTVKSSPQPPDATAALVLADGTVLWGKGIGAAATAVGEVVFNTAMTGYQEALTDPSYAGQIITFTFPHIGNVGTNAEDIESITPATRGALFRADITEPANWRATRHLDAWMKAMNMPGLAGIDTRALTRRIRDIGAPNGVIAHAPDGKFDLAALQKQARGWPGLEGMDLAKEVSTRQSYAWDETRWHLGSGYGKLVNPRFHVAAIDYGAKRNILRSLADLGCKVTVVPADATAEQVLALKPDGVFLSNGPGDPAATGVYAVPTIKGVIESGTPLFGICLGHQLAGAGAGRDHAQDGDRPSWRQPSGEGPRHRQGRDHQPESRLRRGRGQPARNRDGDPRLAVRRLGGRHRAQGQAGLRRAVSP